MTVDPQENSGARHPKDFALGSGTADEPPIDVMVLEELKELAGPDHPDPLGEVLGLFLSDSPVRYQGLIDSWKLRDVAQMHAFAHGLKGSAANMGARRLMSLLTFLDRDLKEGILENAPDLMARIDVEFEAVMTFLRDYLQLHMQH